MTPKTTKTHLTGQPDEAQILNMLRELFHAFGIDPETKSTTDRQAIADRMSDVAGLKGADRWGWRYLHNIMQGHVRPGKNLRRRCYNSARK